MSENRKYYNYVSFYRGIVVYVGKGVGDRWKHTYGGTSNNVSINDFHFRYKYFNDMPLETKIVKTFTSEEEAFKNESVLINRYLPLCNMCAGKEYKTSYAFKEKLSMLCSKLGYTPPEMLESKYDFRFLFTPRGLPCRRETLKSTSPFEYCKFSNNIKIKDELFLNFPEYGLQFMENDPEVHSEMLTFFTVRGFYNRLFEMGNNLFKDVSNDKRWILSALNGESFKHLEKFKFQDRPLNEELFLYNFSRQDGHVIAYKANITEDEKRLKRSERAKVRSKLKAKIKAEEFKLHIRVKLTPKVLEHVKSLGFIFTMSEGWLNLSTENKPYVSCFALSRFSVVKEDKVLTTDFSRYIKN